MICKNIKRVRGLSEKYPVILNISRTDRVALMKLGSESEEILLHIHGHSFSRGARQSAVRRHSLSLCTVRTSHSQIPSFQLRF